MKKELKTRLAVFLSIVMVLPTILGVLPMTALETQAAGDTDVRWYFSGVFGTKTAISVEQGQKFYIGDYAYGSDSKGSFSLAMVKATYKSSKPSVVSVSKNGYTTTKKTGKSTISIKYKGKKITCDVQVVKKGSFGNKAAAAKLRKEVDKIVKVMPSNSSKITVKNGFDLLEKKRAYQKATGYGSKNYELITDDGFLKEQYKQGAYTYSFYTTTNKLAVPQAGRYKTLDRMLGDFAYKNGPTSTRSSKCLKIASVSANTKKITIKLKKAPTAEQILAAQYYGSDNEKISKKEAKVRTSVWDTKEKKYYYGDLYLKKGSKTAVVKNFERFEMGVGYKPVKLQKGHTYRLESEQTWTKGKTVKVK